MIMDWKELKKIKKDSLEKAINENKADEKILDLLHKINENDNLVTTSSCFGRIVFLEYSGDKKSANFYRKWHREVSVKEVQESVEKYKGQSKLWFRVDPFILHVAAKDIMAANKFLKNLRSCGIKRGGIQTISKNKIMIEVHGHNQLVFPAEAVGDWESAVNYANTLFRKNSKKVEQIKDSFNC